MVDTDMQADVRSVDTSESSLDLVMLHHSYENGNLVSPAEIARTILWLIGPLNRSHGEIFTVSDRIWMEQVQHEIDE